MYEKRSTANSCGQKARRFSVRSCLALFLSVVLLFTSVDCTQVWAEEMEEGETAEAADGVPVIMVTVGIQEVELASAMDLTEDADRHDEKVEVFISIAEESGYGAAKVKELESKLEALGYSVREGSINIDVTDLREWYVFDHYDTSENCWDQTDADGDGVPDAWSAVYGNDPKRKYYPFQEGFPFQATVPAYTIADWLANPEYHSGSYPKIASFKEHIYAGIQNGHPMMTFAGYGTAPNIDFMFYDPQSSGEKFVDFNIDSSRVRTHTLTGTGFLVNTGLDSGNMYGYLVYYNYANSSSDTFPASLDIYKLDGINADGFHNGAYYQGSILGPPVATYEISQANWEPEMSVQIKIAPNQIEVRQQPKNASTDISQQPPVLLVRTDDTGYSGFGPLVAYASHACEQASSFTFSNLSMAYADSEQVGNDMLRALEKADFTQEGTQKYFLNLFGDAQLDYNNASVEADLYQGYLKLMQVEGVALITDRDTPFEEYLGKSGVAGSNLCEADKDLTVDELVNLIKQYIGQQNTIYM